MKRLIATGALWALPTMLSAQPVITTEPERLALYAEFLQGNAMVVFCCSFNADWMLDRHTSFRVGWGAGFLTDNDTVIKSSLAMVNRLIGDKGRYIELGAGIVRSNTGSVAQKDVARWPDSRTRLSRAARRQGDAGHVHADPSAVCRSLEVTAARAVERGDQPRVVVLTHTKSLTRITCALIAAVAVARVHVQDAIAPDRAVPRGDQNSMIAHAQLLEKAKQGRIDIYFEGDSIVRRWGALDYPELLANWKANFFGWNAADFGWGADRIENILWRLQNGELDGVSPKAIVLLAGTNNVGQQPRNELEIEGIARGVKAILDICREKAPRATIILTAIFPRNDNLAVMPTIDRINAKLATFADGKQIRFLNINNRLAAADGTLVEGVMNARDKLHPTLKGYQIWADALKPIFRELLGPPATTDLAPPPTGDPSAVRRPH